MRIEFSPSLLLLLSLVHCYFITSYAASTDNWSALCETMDPCKTRLLLLQGSHGESPREWFLYADQLYSKRYNSTVRLDQANADLTEEWRQLRQRIVLSDILLSSITTSITHQSTNLCQGIGERAIYNKDKQAMQCICTHQHGCPRLGEQLEHYMVDKMNDDSTLLTWCASLSTVASCVLVLRAFSSLFLKHPSTR